MKKGLFDRLIEYGNSDYYPLHMPGHKRLGFESFDPYLMDITEIDGFDDLHDPRGLIKDVEDRAARLYGADRSYILVNGVTGGILSAISAVTRPGDTLLMARNCHRSVYSGVISADVDVDYIYPEYEGCLMGGIRPEAVESALSENPHIKAVVITSPTYEGFVSDIAAIAEITHHHDGILVVDEAHGSHLPFGSSFPESAVKYADITLHGLHKTLPVFTQTGLMHIRGDRIDSTRLEAFLHIYQTSSPSYILMAGLERCVTFLENEGRQRFAKYEDLLGRIRSRLGKLRSFSLVDETYEGKSGIAAIDRGKQVILTDPRIMTGLEMKDILRDKYHLMCEVADRDHLIAMTSVMDREEGLDRLVKALNEMDKSAEYICEKISPELPKPAVEMRMREAFLSPGEMVSLREASGRISADIIHVYPPGIPLVAPGEVLTDEIIDIIERYKAAGLNIKGLPGESRHLIKVVI